jgi:hypothetical protein
MKPIGFILTEIFNKQSLSHYLLLFGVWENIPLKAGDTQTQQMMSPGTCMSNHISPPQPIGLKKHRIIVDICLNKSMFFFFSKKWKMNAEIKFFFLTMQKALFKYSAYVFFLQALLWDTYIIHKHPCMWYITEFQTFWKKYSFYIFTTKHSQSCYKSSTTTSAKSQLPGKRL